MVKFKPTRHSPQNIGFAARPQALAGSTPAPYPVAGVSLCGIDLSTPGSYLVTYRVRQAVGGQFGPFAFAERTVVVEETCVGEDTCPDGSCSVGCVKCAIWSSMVGSRLYSRCWRPFCFAFACGGSCSVGPPAHVVLLCSCLCSVCNLAVSSCVQCCLVPVLCL